MAGSNLIAVLSEFIANNNVQYLIHYLNKINLAKLSVDDSNLLLSNLLDACLQYNNTDVIKPIFVIWQRSYPQIIGVFDDSMEDESLDTGNFPSLYTSLFYTLFFTVDQLRICSRGLINEYSPIRVFFELTLYKNVEIITRAAHRVFQVYPEIPDHTIKEALNLADKKNASYLFNFLAEKYKMVAPFAERPEWMGNYTDSDKLPIETEIKIPRQCEVITPDLSFEESLKLLTDGLSQYFNPEQIAERKVEIGTFLRIASAKQIKDLIEPFIKERTYNNLQYNEYLYRVLGPANPFIDSNLEDLEMGDYRMFNCLRFEYVDDDETDIVDWYTGNCLTCLDRIRKRYYAVRRPISGGGWTECFCSWECVRLRVAQLEGLFIDDDNQLGAFEIVKYMINIYEQQIKEIGIQDRTTLSEIVESSESPESVE